MRLPSLPIPESAPGTGSVSAVPAVSAKQRVAAISVAASAGLLVAKLLIGIHVHSLGILAEAAHSGLDLVATGLTWTSIRIAARPADANHPFGHGKFEDFSAFLETALLVVTGLVIAGAAAREWVYGAGAVHLDAWAFGVMVASIVVDWGCVRLLRPAAQRYQSDALEADALNYATDLWTALAVLAGLAAVWWGRAQHIGWLLHGDSVAAILVALAMIYLAIRLGRRAAGVLLDEASPRMMQQLRGAIQDVEGVHDLQRLRLRRVGATYFVDLQLTMDSGASVEGASLVREAITGRIRRQLPQADVVVEMRSRAGANLLERVKAVALRDNLAIHDLTIYDLGNGLDVEFHLELAEQMPLARAHELASRLEAGIRAEAPEIGQIITHIEPESRAVAPANMLEAETTRRRVEQIAAETPALLDCHDIRIRLVNGHLALSCHCTFADELPISIVHERISGLESRLRRALPELIRVTIHPEPGSDNRR